MHPTAIDIPYVIHRDACDIQFVFDKVKNTRQRAACNITHISQDGSRNFVRNVQVFKRCGMEIGRSVQAHEADGVAGLEEVPGSTLPSALTVLLYSMIKGVTNAFVVAVPAKIPHLRDEVWADEMWDTPKSNSN